MIDMTRNLEFYLDKIMKIGSGQRLLIIADTYARPVAIGQAMMNLASSHSIETTLAIMEPRVHRAQEPPKPIAQAMKEVDAIFEVVEEFDICHTTARKEASEAGVRYFLTLAALSEDYLSRPISLESLDIMRERTEKLAKILTQANTARVITPFGTDLTMNIGGRESLPIHPLGNAAVSLLPDYAEAAVSPNEGSSEGVVVIDSSVQGWGYLLREPVRFVVKKGRVEKVEGETEDANRFRDLIRTDENSNNCAAEFGIGTSHTASENLSGSTWDYGRMGTLHIAVGRNNDIGGKTWSNIHIDVLMTKPTVELDGQKILENGKLFV